MQCGKKIADDIAHSTLEKDFPEAVRVDFCAACHKVKKTAEDKLLYWRSKPKKSIDEPKVDSEQLVALFRKGYESQEEKARTFFLALYLIRKKVFVKKKSKKGYLRVDYPVTNEQFIVEEQLIDPALQKELYQIVTAKR